MKIGMGFPLLALSVAMLSACGPSKETGGGAPTPAATATPAAAAHTPTPAPAPRVAVAELQALGGGTVAGKVTFTAEAAGVHVEADISGLAPGDHGFHIHEWGDCSAADGASAGGHFNPGGAPHGAFSPDTPHHAGDLGNITADAGGHATLSVSTAQFSLGSGDQDILGRGVIVHEKVDDFTTQPTGNAGGRIACGVILEQGGSTTPKTKPAEASPAATP